MAIGNTKNPKNVIFMVGDGMGPSYNSAYRYYADNPNTKELDQTAFDKYLKGLTVLTLMILKKMSLTQLQVVQLSLQVIKHIMVQSL